MIYLFLVSNESLQISFLYAPNFTKLVELLLGILREWRRGQHPDTTVPKFDGRRSTTHRKNIVASKGPVTGNILLSRRTAEVPKDYFEKVHTPGVT